MGTSQPNEPERNHKMSDSTVTIAGNLVDDPELRFTPSGIATIRLRVAVNRRWKTRDGDWNEETSYFTATAWRDQAENAAETLQKGHRVVITGRLEQRTWETNNGDKRSVIEIAADEIAPSLKWATATIHKTTHGDNYGAPAPTPQPRTDYAPHEAPF